LALKIPIIVPQSVFIKSVKFRSRSIIEGLRIPRDWRTYCRWNARWRVISHWTGVMIPSEMILLLYWSLQGDLKSSNWWCSLYFIGAATWTTRHKDFNYSAVQNFFIACQIQMGYSSTSPVDTGSYR